MKAKKLLIIGHVWPEPTSSAAGSRMLQLIDLFLGEGFSTTFATATAKTDKASDLETLGVSEKEIELNNVSFDDFISEQQPDIVVFDRFMTEEQFGWRVAETCPKALRILDTEDLHFLRKDREEAFKKDVAFTDDLLFNTTAKREIASIYRCDLSLIISEAEMELLKTKFNIPESLLCYVPFLLHPVSEEQINQLPSFEDRQHFITVGNFLHAPNYQSVLFLKNKIWPLIRKQLPKAELHVYGAYASQKVLQLQNEKQGFLIQGYVQNIAEAFQQSRVCLAPLQYGAGLKGKLIDAMQNGTPCAMSSIASEGMFGDLQPSGFVGDSPETFAQKAVELYQDKTTWETFQQNGFQVINQRFQKTMFQEKLIKTVQFLQDNIGKHRRNNFIGGMLQHHSLQSTKYMSKWIELKNEK